LFLCDVTKSSFLCGVRVTECSVLLDLASK
jgi:hypothetical protein